MKVNSIRIKNFLGIRHLDVEPVTPITMFVGHNGAGKSSIAEAVRMALTGEHVRVSLKKNLANVVTEGQNDGAINVSIAEIDTDGGEMFSQDISVDVKTGKVSGGVNNDPFLPIILDPPRFAGLPANERRQILFDLTGCSASKDDVKRRLTERGCDKEKIERILPMLRSGFDAAHTEAKDQVKDARGAWRGVTGEAYGSKKAEAWTVDVPQIDTERSAKVDDELENINAATKHQLQELGKLNSGRQRAEDLKNEIDKLMPAVTNITSLEATVEIQEQNCNEQRANVERLRELASGVPAPYRYDCPACSAGLMWFDGELHQYAHDGEEPDAEARAALPAQESGLKSITRSLDNTRQRLADARKDQLRVDQIKKELATMPDHDKEIARLQDDLMPAEEKLRTLRKQRDEIAEAQRIADEAEQKTQDAAQHHADVIAWGAIADALSPSGIPGEILSGALRPINDRMHESAAATGWMVPTINAEMEIHADGRPYRLLSESERWRVDAMIAEAISHLSGLKLLSLDRFDILDMPSRAKLIVWLSSLTENGSVETALLFGTLKALPAGLPDIVTAHWLDNGEVRAEREAA